MSDVSSSESAEDLISKAKLLEETRRSLRSEREGLVGQVKEKRASVSVTREKSDSRKKHLSSFHENKEAAEEAKKERDLINKSVPPPVDVLKSWADKSLAKLTVMSNDLTTMPTLAREIREFSLFFELVSAISVKEKGEDAHSRYIKYNKLKIEAIEKLDTEHPKEELDDEKKSQKSSEFKEVRKISKRIDKIDKELDKISKEVKNLRKMAKKLESESKISDAMDRVMSGSSLDATDVALILERGVDLGSLSDTGGGSGEKGDKEPSGKTKKRRISPVRRGARKTRLRHERGR
ncbi:MAG: hypothetical protein CMA64_03950 [Euryarchaeota archaeon]|nr:hypothetical protein [Euryarchaeota archaeon]